MSRPARSSLVSVTGDGICTFTYNNNNNSAPPSPYQIQESGPGDEPTETEREANCPIRNLASHIDSCGKARVIALLAMEFLVYDGKLHGGRTNWACPFGDCKENFPHAKDLMRHVTSCSLFSGDKVYCNSCRKNDCFALQHRENQFCSADGEACGGDEFPRKSKRLGKLTSLFFRSRSSSVSSSLAVHHTGIPSSASYRRASPVGNPPTPEPIMSVPASSWESQVQAIELSTPSGPPHEMGNSAPRKFPDTATDMTHELPTSELCVAGGGSPVSAPDTSPLFAQCLTESPVEDVSEGKETRHWALSSSNNESALPHTLTAIPYSQAPPSWTTSSSTYPALDREAIQQPWNVMQQTTTPLSSRSFVPFLNDPHAGMDSYQNTSGGYNGNIASTSNPFLEAASDIQQKHRSHTWPQPETYLGEHSRSAIPHPALHEPVRPWSRNISKPGAALDQQTTPSLRVSKLREAYTASLIPEAASPSDCLAEETHSYACPYCPYRPSGKLANFRTYLQKHTSYFPTRRG
ncbi:hypothetical protein NOR_07688 [Metarhizium rileyi]|uniref:Uncharacterized protein n=1 Tax=Metarhizium rileyi (strain RCEF 4871) TaxID=1649241 RepID=A0A166XQZ4_METRR|nr:hypothetical protein NOR_07688 [Metarhizium rileyi RCEF 4871]